MPFTLPSDEQLAAIAATYLPGLAVNCVVFGFHDQKLKVLLLLPHEGERWALPGGFVRQDEDVDAAANQVLRGRTGLGNIFLRQFWLFGAAGRMGLPPSPTMALVQQREPWFGQRFASLGYYALVEYTAVQAQSDALSRACRWWELDELPPLVGDHREMVEQALVTLRQRLRQEPVGYQLLPDKFTMPELQKLYETILGRPLDRRNFQRRMLAYDILTALNERRRGGAHKSPRLYAFNPERYRLALEQGLQGDW